MSYLTPKGLAERWGVTERRVIALSNAGAIPTLRIYRARRFRVDLMPERAPEMPQRERARKVRALPPPPAVGVYMLFRGGLLTYVGRSTNLQKRLCTHRNSPREFDEVRIIPCDDGIADWLEAELIRTLQPPENIKRFERRARRVEVGLAVLTQ